MIIFDTRVLVKQANTNGTLMHTVMHYTTLMF